MSTATCIDASNILLQQSNFIGPMIYNQLRLTDPWMSKVEQTPFPEGRGLTQYFTRVAQVIPVDPTFTDIAISVFATPASSCNPTPNIVPGPGQTQVPYKLQQYPFRSPELCIMDLINSVNAEELINAYMAQLTFVTKWYWNRTHQAQFTANAGRQVIANPDALGNMSEGSSSFPLVLPTTTPVQGVLDIFYQDLQFDGATVGKDETGAPVFDMLLSASASQSIIKSDPSYRRDAHYIDNMKNALMDGPRGFMKKSINGWNHGIIQFPARWNFTAGAWVEVKPFDAGVATTAGNLQRVTTAYKTATYEDLYIFPRPEAYKVTVPTKKRSFGSANFNSANASTNYAGEFTWHSVTDNDCNLFGDTGFWLGRIIQGGYSPRPEYAIVVRFIRANYAIVVRDNTFDPACPCPLVTT